MSCYALAGLSGVASASENQFDVNDVSYLWPVPKKADDVEKLIAGDEPLDNSDSQLWPKAAFDGVIKHAQEVSIKNSAGRLNKIDFTGFKEAFENPKTWKIVSFRVDPSSPGCNPEIIKKFGSRPEIRIVLQPVTTDSQGRIKVHDLTAHLVFDFVKPRDPADKDRSVPDTEKFAEIVKDLLALKKSSTAAGFPTSGSLNVHPGLANVPELQGLVRSFLRKHLSEDRLTAVAFMGIDPPEPWIFFAMAKDGTGKFVQVTHRALENGPALQMLMFLPSTRVTPMPSTRNLERDRGVSTSLLFEAKVAEKLAKPVFEDSPRPLHSDIPDIIANPNRSHFFNTDCISCHSESARRADLAITGTDGEFRYLPPDGISGVEPTLLPKGRPGGNSWNVRNFGWFPSGTIVTPTATTRTANEAAESADFINREYLK